MLDLPTIERDVLLICPGFFAQHGRWKGIDMKELLSLVKAKSDSQLLTFEAPDDSAKSSEAFAIDLVKSNQVFLAYDVNGKPLPEKHGFPLRLVAEGAYGDKWIKYVNRVSVHGADVSI